MFVSDWMTKKVFTISPEDSISDAVTLIMEKKIKHVPVVKDLRIKGLISDRDIREFSPSKATSLDVYELHYLINRTKAKEIMRMRVITTTPETPIEDAAMLLYDNGIGCLPVIEGGILAGIITDRDIFRALIDISGARHRGHRINLLVDDRPGSVREVADIIRKHGFSLTSILTSYEKVEKGHRNLVIRAAGDGRFGPLKAELMGTFKGVRIQKG